MSRVLIAEDQRDLARGIRLALEQDGYIVRVASDGAEALALTRLWAPRLLILDLLLPRLDGYHVLRALRSDALDLPVLILSARGAEADKVRGFRIGADDYVTKPFGLGELLARVEALLRRPPLSARGRGHDVLCVGDLELREAERSASVGGRRLELRPKEFDLLLALARRRGGIASRLELLREVWGYEAEVASRTVDTHIVELRRKLRALDPGADRIRTVRKAGYRLAG